MLSVICIILASISNSIMDILKDKFEISIFNKSKFNKYYWDAKISWQNKWHGGNKALGEKFLFSSSVLVWTTDAWHLFKSIMVSLLCLSIVLYEPIFNFQILEYSLHAPIINNVINKLLDLLILGMSWNTTFSLFYHNILLKK